MPKSNGATLQDYIDHRELELRAFNRAIRNAYIKHKAAGVPIAVWEDGKVKIVPPEQIVIPDDEE
jgi:hypothetical protein